MSVHSARPRPTLPSDDTCAVAERIIMLCDLTVTLVHRSYREPAASVEPYILDRGWHIYGCQYAQDMVRELSEYPLIKVGIFTTMTDYIAKSLLHLLGLRGYVSSRHKMRNLDGARRTMRTSENSDMNGRKMHNVLEYATSEFGSPVTDLN